MEYANFCRLVQKGAVVTLAISGVTGPIFVHDVATILPLNIFESELSYSYPFQNASLPNEDHFVNFVQNRLPWQRSLRNWKKRSRSIIYKQISIIWCKDHENWSPSDHLKKKKEEVNASKIYSPVGKFADQAKLAHNMSLYDNMTVYMVSQKSNHFKTFANIHPPADKNLPMIFLYCSSAICLIYVQTRVKNFVTWKFIPCCIANCTIEVSPGNRAVKA